MLKIATWNVNSIEARRECLLAFVQRHAPDVVCLQALKVETEVFPLEDVHCYVRSSALTLSHTAADGCRLAFSFTRSRSLIVPVADRIRPHESRCGCE